tara:strand:- start:122 stop:340 length:219 start_codon:yes stop_codon:yes gene_type:complete
LGLFFVFVKIIEEIIDLLLDLDRNGMIKRNVMFGLEGRAANQEGRDAKKNDFKKKVHNLEDKLNFPPHATEY